MSACYLDASAIAKLVAPEPESQALRDHLSGYRSRITSRLSVVEAARALTRAGEGSIALADHVARIFDGLAIIELDASVAEDAGRLQPASLRSLDAVHLASALSIAEELDAFVTYDHRLADAARSAGLSVVAPG